MDSAQADKFKIAILLATYNGAEFLSQQLDSLMSQSFLDWVLYIQDDLSTDNTLSIIKEYQQRYSNIILLENTVKQGAKKNFMDMLSKVDADYYFFCDQDDIWLPEKVEKSLKLMFQTEKEFPKDKPIVVFSDLKVVDSSLNVIAPSFWKLSAINPNKLKTFNHLGARRVATGCTMLFNKSARDLSLPMPDTSFMHDLWIILSVAKYNGVITWLNTPTILYRQHENNVVGARRESHWLWKKIRNFKRVYVENRNVYQMLQELEYGPVYKYIYYKVITLLEAKL